MFLSSRFLTGSKNRQRDGNVTVLSKCMDTTRIRNGVVCSMHPSEGFWLFKVLFDFHTQ